MPKLVSLEQLDIHYNETKKIFATKRDVSNANYLSKNTADYTSLVNLKTAKQDKLIAGNNIQIADDGKTITATSDVTKAYVDEQIADQSSENVKQNDNINLLNRKVSALEKLNEGVSYRFETDDAEAYQKVIRSGAKAFDLKMLGGASRKCKNLVSDFEGSDSLQIYYPLIRRLQCKLQAGKTYTISFDTVNSNVEAYYQSVPGISVTYGWFKCDGTRKSFQFTTTQDLETVGGALISRRSETSSVGTGVLTNVQIEEGSVATEYEPYTDQIISASVGNVKVQGKNLANPSNFIFTKPRFWGAGSWEFANIGNGYYSPKYSMILGGFGGIGIPVEAGTYSVSFNVIKNTDSNMFLCMYGDYDDGTYSILFYNTINQKQGIINKTVTMEKKGFLYIRPSANTGNPIEYTYKDIQVEKGSVVTPYSPYIETNITIPNECTDLKSAGNVHDTVEIYEQDGKKYAKVIKRIGKKVLTGATGGSATTTKNRYVRTFLANELTTYNYISNVVTVYATSDVLQQNSLYWQKGNYYALEYYNSSCTTKAEYDTYLNANPITIYYELETPIETIIEIDNRFDSITCEANGTITFEGADSNYHLPVPNEEEYMVKLSEV